MRTSPQVALLLDVMSAGETIDASRAALDEAVRLFLDTAAGMGTLEQVLEDAGYERRDSVWESPAWVAIERHTAAVGG